MSRIAKMPIQVPADVKVTLEKGFVEISGPNGALKQVFSEDSVSLEMKDSTLTVKASSTDSHSRAMSGTMRALVNNMVKGVSTGFEKKLSLVGVGYKAQAKGSTLNLALGFSHPINYIVPTDLKATTPSPTEIVISGADKQKVGQVASEIRAYRPPEPYKGKGVRYIDEVVNLKETKKK